MANNLVTGSESSVSSKVSSKVLSTVQGDIYVKNACKSFGVTKALDRCSFTAFFGEIHAVIGGNGCGKSTLAKVLSGVLPVDSGKVSITDHHPTSPAEARAIGVTTVFQEVLVADEASVTDNLFVGVDGFFSKALSEKDKQIKAQAMMSELAGEHVDPLAPAGSLPLSIKAWITIARGLLCEPRVLILDESSAALDFDSTERLFQKIRELRDRGAAILIVTHRIAELIRISDRCTVMRDGRDVGVLEKADITEKNLLQLMTGRSQDKKASVGDAHQTASRELQLRTRGVQLWPDGESVDFGLLKGEVIGVTGLDGHGQDDFVRVLAGVNTAIHGHPEVMADNGEFEQIRSLDEAKSHDIAFVSGDRKNEGILPNLSIFENMLLPQYKDNVRIPFIRIIDWLSLTDVFDWEVGRLGIKIGGKDDLITSLSGGNQQKVMIGRAFANHPKVLVLNDPARGIDLHTKRDLYKQLREFAIDGGSVIYMSSELEEFVGFCSRVLVFRNGSIFEEFVDDQVEGVGILESMFGRKQRPSQVSRVSPDCVAPQHSGSNGGIVRQPATVKKERRQQLGTAAPGSNQSDTTEQDRRQQAETENMSTYKHNKPIPVTSPSLTPDKQTPRYSVQDDAAFESLMDFDHSKSLLLTRQQSAIAKPESAFDAPALDDQKLHRNSVQYNSSDKRQFEQLSKSCDSKSTGNYSPTGSATNTGSSTIASSASSTVIGGRDSSARIHGQYSERDEAAFADLDPTAKIKRERARERKALATSVSTPAANLAEPARRDGSTAPSAASYSDDDLAAFESLLPTGGK